MGQQLMKWGNSLGLRIPAALARQAGLAEGAEVELRVEGTRLVVQKVDRLPAFGHDDLVRALADAGGDLVDYGRSRGDEAL